MALNKKESGNVRAEMIIEVVGRPPEHLTETLHKIIEEISKENGIVVIRKKVNDPQPMKDNPEFYTNFVEVEVEVEEILYLVMLMFKYMPAHIEIISPEVIVLTNNGWNEIINELARRLHGYDEIARVLGIEKSLLEKKLRELLSQRAKETSSTSSQSKDAGKSTSSTSSQSKDAGKSTSSTSSQSKETSSANSQSKGKNKK